MIARHLARALRAAARDYPVVTVTGPRQSGKTVLTDFFKGIDYSRKLVDQPNAAAALVYGGDQTYQRRGISVLAWSDWP